MEPEQNGPLHGVVLILSHGSLLNLSSDVLRIRLERSLQILFQRDVNRGRHRHFPSPSVYAYPWISNCSGCSVASLLMRMFLLTSSSNSVIQRALLALSTLTVSGLTRRRTSAFSKCFRILRS